MDVKKKILQHLEKEGDDARHKDGDALSMRLKPNTTPRVR